MTIKAYFHQMPPPFNRLAVSDNRNTRPTGALDEHVSSLPFAIDYGLVWCRCETEWSELKCRYSRLGDARRLDTIPPYPEPQ